MIAKDDSYPSDEIAALNGFDGTESKDDSFFRATQSLPAP